MPTGLVALLDDVAAIAKLAAASLDDVGAATMKASAKAGGVVIDDTAVTPQYVTGFTPDRELPIIWRIAKGSLFNKIIILLPAAMLLSAFLPGAITPLLMIGGAYLCYEGAEKVIGALTGHHHEIEDAIATLTSKELENSKVSGAVRTDFILSAEIMAIALSTVADRPLVTQGIVLLAVAILITVAVYGMVGFLVKLDDIGLHLAREKTGAMAKFGDGLVHIMPKLMSAISTIGTAAMLWVGGQIVLHGMHEYHLTPIPDWVHDAGHLAAASPALEWLIVAALSGVFGVLLGAVIVAVLGGVAKLCGK